MNTNIKNILVPVDFTATSEVATSKAVELAVALNAEVFLIHVLENAAYIGAPFKIVQEGQKALDPVLKEVEGLLKQKLEALQLAINKQYGVKVQTNIAAGRVDSEIIEYSKKENINLIVMGTHGVSGYREFFLGSNAQRVITLSEIPVLTMQASVNKGFKKILIPIDNSLHSREKVNIAMKMASLFGSEIHILGLPESMLQKEVNKFKIKLESVEEMLHVHNLPYSSSIEYGENLAEVALKYAAKHNFDLIVINTGHESRTTGIFMGALAQQIVNHSKTAVLSVRHTTGSFDVAAPGSGA